MQFAGDRRISESVHFTGFISDDDLVLLYNEAFAAAMPSFSEGFGLPAVEAMACGTPVLSSDQGSLPEVVGDTGVFFDPYNIASISEAIVKMATDNALYNDLSEQALARAATFTWPRAAALAMTYLENLAGGNASSNIGC